MFCLNCLRNHKWGLVAGYKGQCPQCRHSCDGRNALSDDERRSFCTAVATESKSSIDANAIPSDLPAGTTWYEVRLSSGETQRLKNLSQVRDMLLAGTINRFTQARELYRKPSGTGQEQQAALEVWKKRTSWRPIGNGLLNDHFSIHVLYDPIGSHVKYAVRIAFVIATLIGMAFVGIAESRNGFATLGSIYQYGKETSTPGQDGKVGLVALAIYGVLGALIGCAIGVLAGVPLGTAIGSAIGSLRSHSIRRPPPDRFPHKSLLPLYVGSALACVVLSIMAVGISFSNGGKRPTTDRSSGTNDVVDVGAKHHRLELDKSYSDPKGRFSCRIPSQWHVVEATDTRSNVRFESGKDQIRIIARPTSAYAINDSARQEIKSVMQDILDRVNKIGGRGRLLGVYEETIQQKPGLRTELQVDSPEYLWVRQIKVIHGSTDHTIGLYVNSRSNRDALITMFEEFLESYEFGAPK